MKSRKSIELNERFNKRWLGYAAAAGAAGIGVLATPQPSRADIIFTYANSTVPVNGSLNVEMDGETVLTFQNTAARSTAGGPFFRSFFGRAAMHVIPVVHSFSSLQPPFGAILDTADGSVSRLPAGALIGGALRGTGTYNVMGAVKVLMSRTYFVSGGRRIFGSIVSSKGEWPASGEGYVGFMFAAPDGDHYGWALLDVLREKSPFQLSYKETLVGYAYNSVPDAPITAGTGTPEPGTLGLLALGSLGLGFWRRRKAVGG